MRALDRVQVFNQKKGLEPKLFTRNEVLEMAEESFSTQNLFQAAYCLAQGFKVKGTRRENLRVAVILEGQNIQQEALKYYNGGKVEALAYSNAYRTLKDMVFER